MRIERMNISRQVNKLREYSFYVSNCIGVPFGTEKIMNDAADTIESLSAKLADMERSAEDCGKELEDAKSHQEIIMQ